VTVAYAEGRWVGPHSLTEGEQLALPHDATLELRNQTAGPVLAVLEDVAWTRDATTAAYVTTLQEFHDLFSSEVLAPGQHHAVRHLALVFSNLKGSTQLYEGIGDAAAYGRVNRLFEFIKQSTVSSGGAVIKTFGDGVMCAFPQLDEALEAALAMQQQIAPWCREQGIDPPFTLRLGVHAGPVIAISANDRLDYFGRTVNLAARVADQSLGGDVVVLADVLAQASLPADITAGHFTTRLRGLDEDQHLVRLTASRPPAAPAARPAAEPAAPPRPPGP
jgi:class 3 adenylate cyclase